MMSACPSDLNVSGENSIARGSCGESEPVGKEDFSPAGSKTDGAEPLKREVSVLLGRCVTLPGIARLNVMAIAHRLIFVFE
jgi:hypothetical protein